MLSKNKLFIISNRMGGRCCRLSTFSLSHAHVALSDVVPLPPGFSQSEGRAVGIGSMELHPGQPKAVDVGKVVAGASWPLTLHKGLCSKVC